MSDIQNAKITSTSLGDEGSFWLQLDYGGAGQGFGGYRLGGAFTHYVLEGILDTVGVNKWEDLIGKPVRVKGTHSGVEAIGNYLEDKWFNPGDFNE